MLNSRTINGASLKSGYFWFFEFMTFRLLKLLVFVAALGIGSCAANSWLQVVSVAARFDPSSVASIPIHPGEPVMLYSDETAEFDPAVQYAKKLKVKLLRTGEYWADEVPYRSGETWLGLFRCGDSYELRRTKVFIESTKEAGRVVTTSTKCESVFLLRGASKLQLGDVETQFDSSAPGSVVTNTGTFLNEEFGYFRDSAPKVFGNGRGMFWRLGVDNPSPEGFLQKNSSLLLTRSGNSPQLLRILPDGCDDCGWSVEWVGDLDHDRQLDFLIDVNGHYNSYEPTLFLSSEAKEPGSVAVFASFTGVGC